MSHIDWSPPTAFSTIRTIDAHTEGEPLRVILDGFPLPVGDTVLARRKDARERLDHLRTALMWEPRGHADMYGCLVMPPVSGEADFAVLFLHNEGYSTMCGHGIIAVATVAVEIGLVETAGPRVPVTIDTPAGLVRASVRMGEGGVEEVRFLNVPSFAAALDRTVEEEQVGQRRQVEEPDQHGPGAAVGDRDEHPGQREREGEPPGRVERVRPEHRLAARGQGQTRPRERR